MKINNQNTTFSGNLCLKNPAAWTESMKQAITENKFIQSKLSSNDIFAYASTVKEKMEPPGFALHRKGDSLYKVKIVVMEEGATFFEKIKCALGLSGEKININKHYHSEHTTVDRLTNLH